MLDTWLRVLHLALVLLNCDVEYVPSAAVAAAALNPATCEWPMAVDSTHTWSGRRVGPMSILANQHLSSDISVRRERRGHTYGLTESQFHNP